MVGKNDYASSIRQTTDKGYIVAGVLTLFEQVVLISGY